MARPAEAHQESSALVERLTYALASSDSLDEAAANGADLVRLALRSDAPVRIAIPAASGRLRVAWRSGADAVDAPRLRTARRLAFERKAYRSVGAADEAGGVALFFPLVWRDRSLGVLEIQTASDPTIDQRSTIGAISSQLAGVLAGLAERRRLEQQVVTFEATADIARELLQARHPQAALDVAANALWRGARRPVAIWWADPDAARSLVSVVGVGQPAKLRLEDVLGSVRPAGAVVTSTERAQVIGPVVATVGRSTRITVGAGDRCVVVVAASGPLLGRRVEMITALVDDTLPLVASSARRGLEASGLDRGLAWTAHELRTPILGVKAAIESVANRSDPPAEELLRLSVEELDKLASDAEGILGWASGRRGLDRQMVDVSALVAEAVTGTWLGQRNEARIAIDAPRPATAFVDPTQLRVAVTNLLRNALAYAESGSVAISVRGDEGAVRVSVRDGGPGVRPADRDGIFEPFARGGAGGHPTGSGLGLFITRQIAEAHGGRAWVDSDGPGHGATFHIQVPTDGRVLQRPAS